jgi:predicted phage terminase large subunit-like protein
MPRGDDDLPALLAELPDEETADRLLAERSLWEFVRQAWHVIDPDPFQDNWHVGCICEHLEALTALEITRLVINCPPRVGKSALVSVLWLPWVWLSAPETRWMFGTYADRFVVRDTDRTRVVLASGWYRRRWGGRFRLCGRDTGSYLENDRMGFRFASTVGGAGMGEGGVYYVADDPNKVQEVRSPAARAAVREWWSKAVSTRQNDPRKTRRVVVQHRLHEGDLSGYLLAEVGGYEHLVLPMEHEPGRVYRGAPAARRPRHPVVPTRVQSRSPTARDPRAAEGELLWPERIGREAVEDGKKELRADGTAGQYQQRPSAEEGTVFQQSLFRYCELRDGPRGVMFALRQPDGTEELVALSGCRFFQCADTALKADRHSDYTAVCAAVLTPRSDLLIHDVTRARVEVPYQLGFLRACRQGPTAWDEARKAPVTAGRWPKPIVRQYVEEAASGIGLLQAGAAAGVPLVGVSARRDPVERAATLATLYQRGKVYHSSGAPWLSWFEDELLSFPNGAHDDGETAAAHAAGRAVEDAVLRAGLGEIEAAAADYPEWQEYLREQARREAAGGSGKVGESGCASDEAGTDGGPRYKIRLGAGELDFPDD